MNVTDFNFELPQELIAQDPLEDRAASRLLVLNKETGNISHRHFRDIRQYLKKGDCLVINDTKVIPARLIGHKVGTDAKIEVLLLKRKSDNVWETLVKPGKKMKEGAEVSFGDGLLKGTVVGVVDEGNRLIQFEYDGIFEEILDQLGQMPLPPYITHQLKDKNRYQTVYAKHDGSAAAPTAGLHFTQELLQEIQDMGVTIAHVTLHVYGRHNVLNALAAAAAAHALGLPGSAVEEGLAAFTGAGRRFEHKGTYHGAEVYDDYAHHPDELHALLTTAKELPHQRLIVAFQPHTYSRTAKLFDRFVEELKIPDVVILAEIYAAREQNTLGISSSDLCRNIPGAIYCSSLEKVTDTLASLAQPGDLILTVGAGDIFRAGEKLLERA